MIALRLRGRGFWLALSTLLAFTGPAEAYTYHNWCYVVKTSNRSGAGTDANLRLQIDGSKLYHAENTPGFKLNPLMKGNAFEAGGVDEVVRRSMDWGDIRSIQIESDGKYSGADWYPDWICISRDGCGACSAETISRFGNADEGGYLCRVRSWITEGKSGWIYCTRGVSPEW